MENLALLKEHDPRKCERCMKLSEQQEIAIGYWLQVIRDSHDEGLRYVAFDRLADLGLRPPHPDLPCFWCGEYVMDEDACPNAKDICCECCGEDH